MKVYLDFGESFDFGEDFFYEYLEPRTVNGLEVYFEFDLIPKVPKLYSEDVLKLTDLKYKKSDIDGVIISHPHSDHYGHLKFLDENIPIYIGHGAYKVIEAYSKLYPGLVKIGAHNNINFFKSGDKIKIKHLVIEPIHVEHSVPGSYGFIIHTSKGALVYTGDLRMHGPRADMTHEFISKCSLAKPLALLCEGTRMSFDSEHNYSEKEVEEKISSIIKSSEGIVFCYFSMINVDRFMSAYNACKKNKRIMVIDTRLAYIMNNLREKIAVIPDILTDKNIKVYFRISKTGSFVEKDYKPFEREFMKNMITHEDLISNQKDYFMHLNFYRLMELVYIQPSKADFIYSSSEHFLEGEDNEDQRKIWENWMKHFGIKFHKAHCSGHASKQDLIDMIKKINPSILIPIHTESAEEFKKVHENVKIPDKGKTMEV